MDSAVSRGVEGPGLIPSRDRIFREFLRLRQRGQISLHRAAGVQQRLDIGAVGDPVEVALTHHRWSRNDHGPGATRSSNARYTPRGSPRTSESILSGAWGSSPSPRTTIAASSRFRVIVQCAIDDRGAGGRPPSLLVLRPGHRPVSLERMGGDVLVLRLDPAILQHGIDVVVPKRVLAPVQQISQIIKGQVPPLAEAENCCFDYFPRRFPHRSNRSCNLAQCIQMFGACDQMFEAFWQMFGAPRQMFGARLRTDPRSSEHFTLHRVAAGTVIERAPARPLAHQKPFLDQAVKSHGDVVRVLFRHLFEPAVIHASFTTSSHQSKPLDLPKFTESIPDLGLKLCHWRCKIPHFRRDKFPHPTTFMQPCEGSGNAEDGGTSRDTRSIQSRTEQKSDCPKCQRRRNFVHFRRSKSVHLLTLNDVLEGRSNVHCGGISHDPRLASSGAEHQPDLPGRRDIYSAKIPCCPNHANTGFPKDTAEQTRSL